MTLVINRWSGRAMGGTYVPTDTVSRKMYIWNCDSISSTPFIKCYWTLSLRRPLYITESVYKTLSETDKAHARSYGNGCVKDSGYFTFIERTYDNNRYIFNPDSIIPYPEDDPCKDVSCPDKCIGVDKYDQVCQDGICVRGTLIETNSVHCGYTPEPEPDPTPPPSSDTYIIVALMLAGTYIILRR